MEGWMDRDDGRMKGYMMDGQVEEYLYGKVDEPMDGQMKYLTNGHMDR